MLSLSTKLRVFIYTHPTDMRKGFDGLHGLVREVLRQDPLSGDLFVFFNRCRNRVKILLWDGQGLIIWYKRLEQGTFAVPQSTDDAVNLTTTQLAMILDGIDLKSTRQRARYRRAS